MNTQIIVDAINQDFAKTYRSAAKFVDSGVIWDFCMETIQDPVLMSSIVFANDLKVPPVKSLLLIYQRKMNPVKGFKFSAYDLRCMGALMSFVFKYVLGYKKQKERTVNLYGIRKATRYLNGPVTKFYI